MLIDSMIEEIGTPSGCRWRRVTGGGIPNCMFWYPGSDEFACQFAVMECGGFDMLGLVVKSHEMIVLYCFEAVSGLSLSQPVMMAPKFELSDPNCFQKAGDLIRALVKSGDYVPLPV